MSVFSSAPLLEGFRLKSGTFYTLSSSVRDMSLLFSSDQTRMAFSKFALLNIPNWENTTTQSLFFDGANNLTPPITDPNDVLPKSLLQKVHVQIIRIRTFQKLHFSRH